MNYKKIYDQLVEKCRVRGLDKSALEGYYEKHHIVPKCMGGGEENENFVLFTAREHFIAHRLLWKFNPDDLGCARAVFLMCANLGKINSRCYELARIKISEGQTKVIKKDLTGHSFGRLTVVRFFGWKWTGYNNIATWLCSCECGGEVVSPTKNLHWGSTQSCGCLLREYSTSIAGENNPFYGKTHSDSTKDVIRNLRLSEDIKPWETPLGKKDKPSLDKWAVADTYYDLWAAFGEPSRRKLRTIYNYIFNDEVEPDFFKSQVKKFQQNWNPHEDLKWKSWSAAYLSDTEGSYG